MNNLDLVSIIFFVLGILSFIGFIILAVKYHMLKLIADLFGITAKRTIKNMKSDTGKYSSPVITTQKIATDRMAREQTAILNEDSSETTILETVSNPKFVLESEIGFHDSDEIIK